MRINFYGDGQQIRDWLYVDDHPRGIDLIIRHGRKGEPYNVGGINEWENIDIVNLICDLVDQKIKDHATLKNFQMRQHVKMVKQEI